jgi:hypothetical protein
MTSTDSNRLDPGTDPIPAPDYTRPSFNLRTVLRGHGRIKAGIALVVVAALVGAAYVAGGPPSADATTLAAVAAPTTAPAVGDSSDFSQLSGGTGAVDQKVLPGIPTTSDGSVTGAASDVSTSTIDTTQIVKTGEMTLEVAGIDDAVGRAQTAIAGMGGTIDSSNRYGTDDNVVATITFRVPVAKWDEALAAMQKIGTKVISEQTSANDVTSQVVDLDARIANLKATESALQAIMARASAIPDVIAVENQLSDTRGQIESLTAQDKVLKDQAAMSTLAVTFQLPSETVITTATQDWTLGSQVDEAGAALVRIGQGLATIAVWFGIVVVPFGLVLIILFGVWKLVRRIRGRGRGSVAVQA